MTEKPKTELCNCLDDDCDSVVDDNYFDFDQDYVDSGAVRLQDEDCNGLDNDYNGVGIDIITPRDVTCKHDVIDRLVEEYLEEIKDFDYDLEKSVIIYSHQDHCLVKSYYFSEPRDSAGLDLQDGPSLQDSDVKPETTEPAPFPKTEQKYFEELGFYARADTPTNSSEQTHFPKTEQEYFDGLYGSPIKTK